MKLSLNEIYTYLHCPMKYQLEYINQIETEPTRNQQFHESMEQAILSYYHSLSNNRVLTFNELKTKWSKLWERYVEEKNYKESLFSPEHSRQGYKRRTSEDKYVRYAAEQLHFFYLMTKKEESIPIIIDHEFETSFADILVKDYFKLIREKVDKKKSTRFIDIVDFRFGTQPPDGFLIGNQLGLTIQSHAFLDLFQKKEDRIMLYFLKQKEEISTRRGNNDYNRAKATVHGVANGISRNEFYPKQGVHCKQCPVKDYCDRVQFD